MNEKNKNTYCCEKFTQIIESPDAVYCRDTTFMFTGKWVTDFSDGEYGDIDLIYCPFCGKKLEPPEFMAKYGWNNEIRD